VVSSPAASCAAPGKLSVAIAATQAVLARLIWAACSTGPHTLRALQAAEHY